jgi:ubiquinone/menaquinone biosynthesis C-methylase UbiE
MFGDHRSRKLIVDPKSIILLICLKLKFRNNSKMILKWSGERYIPGVPGNIEVEHKHRYHLAIDLAKNKVVLDLACGEGYGTAMLSSVAKKVIGIDISQDAVLHANMKYKTSSNEFKLGDCQKLPIDDNSIDLVVSFETIEHHDKHHEMLSEIIRVLKPDGLLLISSPDRDEYAKTRTGENEFHVKELSSQEFNDLLKIYFTNIDFYAQRVINASGISPVQETSAKEFKHIVSTKSGDIEQSHIHPAVYHIALAGNVAIPSNLGTSLYELVVSDNSNPQAGSIRVGLLSDRSNSDSVHFADDTSVVSGAMLPFDTRIYEAIVKIPDDETYLTRIGMVPADQPCALALHECSFFSSDNRLLWHWDGLENPFALSDFAVFIPGEDKTPALIVSLGNNPIAWFNLPAEVLHELHGGIFRLRAAGFTLYDSQTLNRLNSYISNNFVVGNGNESGQLLSIEAQSDFLGRFSRQSAAQQSSSMQDLDKKLVKVQVEFKRAEAQLGLLKNLWLDN